MTVKNSIYTCFWGLCALISAAAYAQVPQALRDVWENPDLREKIDAGIKANRMGMFTIEFDKPVENVKVDLQRHEFLFGFYASRAACDGVVYQKFTPEQIAEFSRLTKNIFNYGTFACVWKRVNPEKGKMRWNYDNDAEIDVSKDKNPTVNLPDIAVDFCKKNDLTMKAHCLSWMINREHFVPEWAFELKDRKEVEIELERNIKRIVDRYADQVHIWDVVNESSYVLPRDKVNIDDYIFKAFKYAQTILPPSHTLIINELTTVWGDTAKYGKLSRFYKNCQDIISRGAKVDAIGLQFHIFSRKLWNEILSAKQYTPSMLEKVLDCYQQLGRPVHITEITVPSAFEGGEEAQAYYAENLYQLWFSHPSVEAITWWNMRDGQAAPSETNLLGGLLRPDFKPKPIYKALENLIAKKWHTTKSFEGTRKNVTFSAFYGRYKVTYMRDGKEYSTSIMLGKNTDKLKKIEVK